MSVLEKSAENLSLLQYQRRQSEDGFVRVDIQSLDPITQALEKCEKYVLRWYRLLLKIVGWTPFTCAHGKWQSCFQIPWMTFWIFMILLAFVAQILSCFRRDKFATLDIHHNTSGPHSRVITCKDHVFTSFIITDIPLLAAYILGVILFSKEFKETEYLSNLAEKAFIQSSKANCEAANQRLYRTMFVFLILGLFWIIFSLCVRILAIVSLGLFSDELIIQWDHTVFKDGEKIILILLSLVGFVFFDVVYIVAVMNYAAQSEMNIHLLRATKVRLEEKIDFADIDAGIKEVLECKEYLHVLNGKTAAITALIFFDLGAAGVLALISLNDLRNEHVKEKDIATIAAALNAIFWLGLISFPFVQAARVTHAGERLKTMGPKLRSRPQQYSNTPQLDLDSFVQFTQAVQLRATMFGIPIYPWTVYAVFVSFAFTMLVLLQTGTYYVTDFF